MSIIPYLNLNEKLNLKLVIMVPARGGSHDSWTNFNDWVYPVKLDFNNKKG
jgi:hypothetical protein